MLTNAQIKEIKKLNEKSKARREAGLFVIEGPKMFAEAPVEWVEKIYVTREFLDEIDSEYTSESSSATTISQMIQWMDHEIVTKEQMAKISDTQTPQGILCILRQPTYSMEEMFEKTGKSANSLYMVLEDIQDPGNLGTIFRTAEGAGGNWDYYESSNGRHFQSQNNQIHYGVNLQSSFFLYREYK